MKRHILVVTLLLTVWLTGCGKGSPLPATATLAPSPTNSPIPSTAAPAATPTDGSAGVVASATAAASPEPMPTPSPFPAPGPLISWSGLLAAYGWQLTVDYDGILLYDLDTLSQQRLTSWDGAQYPPRWAWSPDGDRIYFENQILTLSTGQTLDLSRLAAENPSAGGGLVRWHPHGNAILLGGLLVQADSGSPIEQVSEIPPYQGGWSNDGQKLALVNWDNFISLADVEMTAGGQVTGLQITHDSCGVQAGSRLVCLGPVYHSETPNAQVLEVEATLSRIEDLQWSPTSDRLIFSTEQELYLYEPASDRLVNVTQGFLASSMRFMGGQHWSPDGQRITFSLLPTGGGYPQVFMVSSGGGIIEITGGQHPYGAFPTWSPDGQWIFYSSSSPESGGQVVARRVAGMEWISLPPGILGFTLEFRPGAGIGAAPVSLSPCSASWSRLAVGNYAVVTGDEAASNRVRSEPVFGDNVIGFLVNGMVGKVIDGPVCLGEYTFWMVENSTIPGKTGWTAEGDSKNYWLAPYGSQAAVTSPAVIYFSVGNSLYAMDINGRNVRPLLQGLDIINSITGDLGSGRLYFNHWDRDAQVQSLALDGTATVENFMDGPADGGQGLAIDRAAGLLFQGLYYQGLYALNLTNMSWSQIVRNEQLYPLLGQRGQLELDIGRAKIYFRTAFNGDCGECRMIYRVNYDGSGLEALVPANGGDALAVDTARGVLYFSDVPEPNTIRQADLDGTNVKTLLTFAAPYDYCRSMAFSWDGYLYLSLMNSNGWNQRAIARMRLDGSGYEVLYEMFGSSEVEAAGALFFWPGTTSEPGGTTP